MSAILIPERRIRRNFKPDFPVRLREGGFPRPDALTLLRDVADQKYFDVARDDWYTISSAGLVARPTPFGLGVHNTGSSGIYLESWPSIGIDIDAVSGVTAILVLDYRQALTGAAYERYWPHYASTSAACGVFLDSSGFRYTVRNSPVSAINPASYGLQVVVMRISDANGQQFWRNGVLDYDASLSTFWNSAASGAQIYSSGAEAKASSNSLLAMGYWAQDLGPSFCEALSAEGLPMLLRPKRQAICVPMASGGAIDLVIADSTHGHTADSLGLTSSHLLTIADAAHAHSADSISLTTLSVLVVADALHGHLADNVVLSLAGAENLVIADALHAHAADNIALTSQLALSIAESAHAHTADGVVITVQSVLAVADALHAHLADNITLSDAQSLNIAESSHAHAADGFTLTTDSLLAIADAAHAHLADNVSLTYSATLAIVEAMHAHAADNVALNFEAIVNALLSSPRGGAFRNLSSATRSNLQTARRPKA